MLDLYAIDDCDERWEEPKEEFFLGSLSQREHQALAHLIEELQLEDNGLFIGPGFPGHVAVLSRG